MPDNRRLAGGVMLDSPSYRSAPPSRLDPDVGPIASSEPVARHEVPLRAMAWLIGCLLFVPALGIPIQDTWLQPLDVIAIPALLIAIPSIFGLRLRAAIPIVLTVFSWTLSAVLARQAIGMIELLFYLTALAPTMICAAAFLGYERGRDAFVSGFLLGGIPSAAIGVMQGLVGGSSVIDLRTNAAFNLLPQPGRSMAFFPEASAFAAATAIHASCVLIYRLTAGEEDRRRIVYRFAPALIVLDMMGLAFARSTSTLLLIPVLVVIGLRVLGYSAPRALNRLILIGPVVAILGFIFITEFYSTRFANRDAFNSIETRLSTILAAVGPLSEGQLFGVGVGNNELAEPYILEISRERGLRAAVTTGITSLLGQRVFEEGIGAIVSVGFSAVLLWRCLGRTVRTNDRVLAILSGGLFLSFVFVSGYRGLYTSWLWIPIAGAFWHRTKAGRFTDARGIDPATIGDHHDDGVDAIGGADADDPDADGSDLDGQPGQERAGELWPELDAGGAGRGS